MADPQVVPGEPTAPSAAQPDQGGASQEQAQQLADMISSALSEIVDKMKKILEALQNMGVDQEKLSMAAQAGDEFMKEVQEALGLQQEDQSQPEEQNGQAQGAPAGGSPVPMEAGSNGQPTV